MIRLSPVLSIQPMTIAASNRVRWTIEDLEGFPENGNRYENVGYTLQSPLLTGFSCSAANLFS